MGTNQSASDMAEANARAVAGRYTDIDGREYTVDEDGSVTFRVEESAAPLIVVGLATLALIVGAIYVATLFVGWLVQL